MPQAEPLVVAVKLDTTEFRQVLDAFVEAAVKLLNSLEDIDRGAGA